jgi:PHP family Zn ribbon phosphoesterase
MNRVEQLADRPEGFVPENAIPYKNLIPLDEIIAEAKGIAKGSLSIERDYRSIVSKFGNEFDVLMKVSEEELRRNLSFKIAEGIMRMRQGKINIRPGFDGEYGKISIFEEEKKTKSDEQLSLF